MGDMIRIVESEWGDPVDEKIVHHGEGYLKMKPDKEYFLYLGYDEVNDTYYTLGLILGKNPRGTSEDMVREGALNEEGEGIVKELRARHD